MQRWECWLSLGRVEGNLPACSLEVNFLSTISRVLFTLPVILNASLPIPCVLSTDFQSSGFLPKNFSWTKHLHQFHSVPVSATQLHGLKASLPSSTAALTRPAGPGRQLWLVVVWLLPLQIQGCSSRGWQPTILLTLELEDQRIPTLTSSFAWLTSPAGLL